MKPILEITDLNIINSILNMSISIKFRYDDINVPRLGIIFSNELENRRLPFKITSFNIDHVSKCCFISANEKFEIDNLFLDKDFIGDININFSLIYGNEIIENFSIKYLNRNRPANFKKMYYLPKFELNKLYLEPNEEILRNLINNKQDIKYRTLKKLNSFFLGIISIISFPFFFIDGYLASKGLVDKSPNFYQKNNTFGSILMHINWKTSILAGFIYSKRLLKIGIMGFLYKFFKHKKIVNNRILFLSERKNYLSGNFQSVYNILSNDNEIEIVKFLLNKKIKDFNIFDMIHFVNFISTSKIILLDDFYPNIHNFNLKNEVKLIQLWHAAGAFKTFGFSRLGKIGGVDQSSSNHRSYDYAIVSSNEIKRFYSEGFGISDEKVVVTGIPRTDIFFDDGYKKYVLNKIYDEFPMLKNKKIILFSPTFRGEGKDDAYYPMEKFNIEKFLDSLNSNIKQHSTCTEKINKLGNEKSDNEFKKKYNKCDSDYVLIIKQHPFINKKIEIPEKYKNNVFDFSNTYEINDILFITDILITDYSSVVFEASILDIPMLFYCYDFEEYLADRGFYHDFNNFAPGKIVYAFEDIAKFIKSEDLDKFKIDKFKNRFFEDFDGKSSKRVFDLIKKLINLDNK